MHIKSYKNRRSQSMAFDYEVDPLDLGSTRIGDLIPTEPRGSRSISEGDDHLRAIKSSLQGSFPAIGRAQILIQGSYLNAIMQSYVYGKVELWYGDPLFLPPGFVVCDGKEYGDVVLSYGADGMPNLSGETLYTVPDLRDRMFYHQPGNWQGWPTIDSKRHGGDNEGVATHSHDMAHTHSRGTMEITGNINSVSESFHASGTATGAFTKSSHEGDNTPEDTNGGPTAKLAFKASDAWTGNTSQPNTADTADTGTEGGNRPAFFAGVYIAFVGIEAWVDGSPRPPTFDSQPENQTVESSIAWSMSVIGDDFTDQWWEWAYEDNGEWNTGFADNYTGTDTTELNCSGSLLAESGRVFRCGLENAYGITYSEVATLTVTGEDPEPEV